MVLTGNCQIQTDRFQPTRWWLEVRESKATIIHYLGVVIPMLLNQPASDADTNHQVRFGFGAGVEPQLHAVFEQRFGFPLLELWGMTEIVRALVDNMAPRQVGTRAFGRAVPGLEARVVDDADHPVPDEMPGELVVRHSEVTPRKDFFSCYLDDEQATEAAWRGGWFHTGDIVRRDQTGMLHFVDRRKHIIRRSGENIAAAEIEALLLTHPLVQQVAVLPVKDEVREQEVLACIVLKDASAVASIAGQPSYPSNLKDAGQQLFNYCLTNLAYYKAPGWIWFTDQIPTTQTQKIQKHLIFPADIDPRTLTGMMDMRLLKKRDRVRAEP
jgi:crotonobetaine/carnitine-CoA ligase